MFDFYSVIVKFFMSKYLFNGEFFMEIGKLSFRSFTLGNRQSTNSKSLHQTNKNLVSSSGDTVSFKGKYDRVIAESIEMLKSRDYKDKIIGIRSLGNVGGEEHAELIKPFLRSSDNWIRTAAEESLQSLASRMQQLSIK